MNQKTRDRIKSAWAFYQRQMFDFTIGWNEIMKPLAPFKDAAIFTIVLKLMGIASSTKTLVIVYAVGTCLVVAWGKVMRINGVIKFNNFLQNQENEMMMKIDELAAHIKK